jgi:hypothetical protein
MKRMSWIPIAFVALSLAACGGSGGGAWAGSVRDSAGIAIVSNPDRGVWSAEAAPRVVEELRIGEIDGAPEYQFAQITGLDADAAGNIYVLDTQARRVRVFSRDGEFLREMGGAGSGPGELGAFSVGLFLMPGDTVLVVDMQQQRFTRWTADGRPIGSTPIDLAQGIPMRFEKRADGGLVQQARRVAMGAPATTPPGPASDLLLVRGADGALRDTLFTLPAGRSFEIGDGTARIRLFEAEPIWTLVGDTRVAYGMNDNYRIQLRRMDGGVERIIVKDFTRQSVTESDRSGILDFLRRAWVEAGVPPAAMDQLMAGVTFGDFYPAFSNLLGGPGGTLWVQQVRSGRQMLEAGGSFDVQDIGAPNWDIFDREGRYLGTQRLPDRFQPVRVRDRHIYGVWRDDLDVQHVVRLRIDGL